MNIHTSLFRRIVAFSAAAGMVCACAPLTVASAEAAEIHKPIAQNCHSNGVPLNFKADMVRDADHIKIVTPDNVKVGDEFTITVDYRPYTILGKQQGADVIAMKNIVVRFALNDPSAFVTARIIAPGQALTTKPNLSLVGGNRLILSNMDVAVNGKDTVWSPPIFSVTLRATEPGELPTIHQAIEGAAGQKNNPENWITMENHVHHPIVGNKTFPMNCLAVAKNGGPLDSTLATVKATGSAHDAMMAAKGKKGAKASEKKSHHKKGKRDSTSAMKTDENGLRRVDTDIYADEDSVKNGMPGWGIALIVIIVLAAAGGIGYGIYAGKKKKKNKTDAKSDDKAKK